MKSPTLSTRGSTLPGNPAFQLNTKTEPLSLRQITGHAEAQGISQEQVDKYVRSPNVKGRKVGSHHPLDERWWLTFSIASCKRGYMQYARADVIAHIIAVLWAESTMRATCKSSDSMIHTSRWRNCKEIRTYSNEEEVIRNVHGDVVS